MKRIKITGGRKVTKRHPHQNHFNAKESGNRTRSKRGTVNVPGYLINVTKALIPNY